MRRSSRRQRLERGHKPDPELERLSNIIRDFNDRFGNIEWRDEDTIERVISEELPSKVAADKAYQNAVANSDRENARIEHDRALERAVIELLSDHTELFKQFSDNPSFRKWLSDTIFAETYPRGIRGSECIGPLKAAVDHARARRNRKRGR